MAGYKINLTNGAILATVADGTLNTSSTSISLIGLNFAGYGEFLNENIVRILENFSNTTSPANPLAGQLWWDNTPTAKSMKVYTGTAWKPVNGSTSANSAPLSPLLGDQWYDTVNRQLKVYDTNALAWVVIGPAYTYSQGQSGAVAASITDNVGTSHVVVKFLVSDVVVALLSKDTTSYTIGTPGTILAGFSTISPGFNLSNLAAYRYNGSASNAESLGSYLWSEYARMSLSNTFGVKQIFGSDDGVQIGSACNVRVSGGNLIIENTAATKNIILSTNNGAIQGNILTIDGTTGLPLVIGAPTVDLGIATKKYVDDSVGGSGATSLSRLGSNRIAGVIYPDADNTRDFGTAAAKFASIYATTFVGVATSAKYADLAERFESDNEYDAGTIVQIGGIKEITVCDTDLSENVLGVISSNPAYLMNAAAGDNKTHPPVAVQGRVPVKVIGKAKKGDRLVSAGGGLARVARKYEITPFNVIGRSLVDKLSDTIELIEAVVRVNT